jgi:hypothetical protein
MSKKIEIWYMNYCKKIGSKIEIKKFRVTKVYRKFVKGLKMNVDIF